MPVNKNAQLRYRILDRCFSDRHHYYDIEELVDKVNEAFIDMYGKTVSLRQIRADISYMKDRVSYDAPIEAIPYYGKKCYYQQIEKFASIYLKISDIAVILDIPADVLREDIADRTSEVSKAYRRGKAGSKVKLHSQEMMLAQVGSPLAIENAHRNLLDMEDDE